MNVLEFARSKAEGRLLSVTTCYDFWSARILAGTDVDALLVGDSAAMVMHGHPTTLPATTEMMALHVGAVSRGAPDKLRIADMPFLAHRKGLEPAMDCVATLMRAGAHAVKLEGAEGNIDMISHVVESGVPVMGHLGLLPQSIHRIGGYRVQGREAEAAQALVEDAARLEQAGCFSIVLEGIPAPVAQRITDRVSVPTIGIGAGRECDGQVLVLHDLAGLQREWEPKFVRRFGDGFEAVLHAVEAFDRAVKDGSFPSADESYE
jgi:3-methyl-2-oxobutanoate hydroxymethyltransferase